MESTGDLDEIPRRWDSHGGNRKPQRVCSRKKEKYGNGHSHDRGSRIASLIAKGSGGLWDRASNESDSVIFRIC